MENKIYRAVRKFDLDLSSYSVLTEAASGNYACTPVIAAISGAKKVYALVKNSKFASKEEAIEQVVTLSEKMNVNKQITIIEDYSEVNLNEINILTNTGFNRPINKEIIEKLNPERCVIPLMWEPWEYRTSDLDLDACYEKGIKVYGTNESDSRLLTMDYIGFIVLYWLLYYKCSPFSCNALLLGTGEFSKSVAKVLSKNNYNYTVIPVDGKISKISLFNAIICLEHSNERLLIGNSKKCLIKSNSITDSTIIIHIAGNVDFADVKCSYVPENPAGFAKMSFTTDFIDSAAVVDLHTAGLSVAQGMLQGKNKDLTGSSYKKYLEHNFPALAFKEEKYW